MKVALFAAITVLSAYPQSFEVASVRPHDQSKPTAGPLGLSISGNRVSALNMTPMAMLMTVQNVQPYQVVGYPDWSDEWQNGSYDVLATAPEGTTPTRDEARVMLGKLLADRFRLAFHEESREFPVYNLALAKGGHKLVKSKPETLFSSKQSGAPENPNFGILWAATNVPAAQIGTRLQGYAGRPVIDKTGLEGGYDFTLKWLQDRDGGPSAEPAAGGLPSLTTALREQLGLTLESSKVPFRVLVVDHVERPSDN